MNKKLFFSSILLLGSIFNFYAQENDSSNINSIDEITVTAYRTNSELSKIPHQLKVIQSAEIISLPANGLDDLLKKSASVDVVQYPGFSSTISMRGFSPTSSGNTLVLIDGIPVGTENISTLSLENVSQVEILKGPFSSFFGSNAMGGVINIGTKKSKEKLSGNTSFSYGSFNTFKINTRFGGRISNMLNFDFYANANAQRKNFKTGHHNLLKLSDYEKLIMDEKSYGAVSKNTKYWQYSVGGRLGFKLNENWEINVNQDYWTAKDIQTNGTFWGVYGAQGKDINRWSQNLSLEGKTSKQQIRFSPFFSNENNNFYNDVSASNFKISDYNFKTYGAILNDAISIGNHQLIIGMDNMSKKYVSKQWADVDSSASPYQPDYLNMATGIYMQANINLFKNKLNASIGARYDNIVFKLFKTELIESVNATENYNVFNPNFGIQYKFQQGLKLHAAGGRAFLAPDAFKVAGNYITSGMYGASYKGNPDLKPETSVSFDFGLAFSSKKSGINTDITYFTTNYKDIVVYDYSNMDYVSFLNADNANMNGLEISFDYDFGALNNYLYKLKFYMEYTHLFNAKIKNESPAGNPQEQMKYVRMDKAVFGVEYDNMKGFTARINARYIGERFEDNWLYNYDYVTYEKIPYQDGNRQEIRPSLINENILKHPDFLIFDLSTSYTLKEKFVFGLKIDNLLDDNYTEKDSFYMPGRSYLVSLSFKF
jgi:vitamin B12 transporter